MWKFLICDDDEGFLQETKQTVLKLFADVALGVELFRERQQLEFYVEDNPGEINVVLMDIKLKDGSGIELAKKVLYFQPCSQIIFVSGYDRYYLDVYDVEHVYFLPKPLDDALLKKAVARAVEHIKDIEYNCFVVSNKNGSCRIPYNDILYLENELRKVHVHTAGERVTYYGRFEDLPRLLDDRFRRCHNSYIVNMSKVRKLKDKKFYFENGKTVPISRTYYSEMRKAFLEHLDNLLLKNNI